MFVKPAEGLRVIDPVNKRQLPADGGLVPDTPYWFRRVAQGDVTEIDPPPAAETFLAHDHHAMWAETPATAKVEE